jgi:hypothetical protein
MATRRATELREKMRPMMLTISSWAPRSVEVTAAKGADWDQLPELMRKEGGTGDHVA